MFYSTLLNRYTAYSSLVIAIGVISVAYAAKLAFSIINHNRNKQANRKELLTVIRENKELF